MSCNRSLQGISNYPKEADIQNLCGLPLNGGLNFGNLTQRYMEIEWCSFKSFEQCTSFLLGYTVTN